MGIQKEEKLLGDTSVMAELFEKRNWMHLLLSFPFILESIADRDKNATVKTFFTTAASIYKVSYCSILASHTTVQLLLSSKT